MSTDMFMKCTYDKFTVQCLAQSNVLPGAWVDQQDLLHSSHNCSHMVFSLASSRTRAVDSRLAVLICRATVCPVGL